MRLVFLGSGFVRLCIVVRAQSGLGALCPEASCVLQATSKHTGFPPSHILTCGKILRSVIPRLRTDSSI